MKKIKKISKENNNFNRRGLVDGIPFSFDFSYIVKSKKECEFCSNIITQQDIDNNYLIYTDEFNFSHKDCISKNNIEYKHLRKNDYSSPITIIKSTIYKLKEKKETNN